MNVGRAAVACLLLALCGAACGAEAPQRVVVDQGIRAEFGATPPAQPGEPVAFRFQVTDTASGSPLRGLRPAAWLSRREPGAAAPNCKQKAAAYVSGGVFRRADVDLNGFFVLTLNTDATVSVVDPRFGFGGTRLLTLLQLESRGEDWVLLPEQSLLAVSMPQAGKVAFIDTRRWRILDAVRTGPNPRRIVATGSRVWVADDKGVSAIDAATRRAVALPLGGAASDLAASSDGAWLFASSGNRVAVIDAHAARVVRVVKVDGSPTQLAYSQAAAALYALDPETGSVFSIDARAGRQPGVIEVRPGAAQIRFAPGGRYALIPNPAENLVQVLDAASNRLAHAVTIADGPDQVSFSDRLAYVRRRGNEIVQMIALEQLGNESRTLGLAEFPGGRQASGTAGSLAASMAGAPGGTSMLVANGADRMVYMYTEGMAAPAGGFRTYSQTPQAVLSVDHGLREVEQGAYATTMPVRQGGLYDVVLFIDAPRVVACFAAAIEGDPAAAPRHQVRVTAIDPPQQLVAGHSTRLRFALDDAEGRPMAPAADVRALAFAPPGVWQRRVAATLLPDGRYEVEFTPPQAGVYYVWIESESLALPRNNPQYKIFRAN